MSVERKESSITKLWRPILMLTITAIIGWNFLLSPITEAAIMLIFSQYIPLSIPIPGELWNLLMVGVGGYIVGRSGEKIVSNMKKSDS